MNLPNKLTLLRVFMVPFFVAALLLGDAGIIGGGDYIAFTIFVLASLTDLFDGMIARKNNLITNFGKFADPLADKLLVCSAFICLSCMGRIAVWITIIVICREFVVSGIRLVAVEEGKVIAASMWGKVKTFESMAMLAAVILHLQVNGPKWAWWGVFEQILIYVSLALTVISMIDYIVKNKDILKDVK